MMMLEWYLAALLVVLEPLHRLFNRSPPHLALPAPRARVTRKDAEEEEAAGGGALWWGERP